MIANTRIFYTLLAGGKLPSVADLQHYLAYTVKIMELSLKHSWISVLRYDDEFRQLQGAYNCPWSFDSNHLHSVLLEPISTRPGGKQNKPGAGAGGRVVNSTTNFTTDGRIICRNYNYPKGCYLQDCNLKHVCNKKVNGRLVGRTIPTTSTWAELTPPLGLVGNLRDRRFPLR